MGLGSLRHDVGRWGLVKKSQTGQLCLLEEKKKYAWTDNVLDVGIIVI